MALEVGDLAPPIEREASDGKHFSLAARKGKFVVLYFYPKSFTPTCSRETESFRDVADELNALGAELVGVSTDDLSTQCKFSEALSTGFPLVPDPDSSISKAYGVLWPFGGFARRVTFLIGPDQTIRKAIWHELSVRKHLQGVLDALKAEQAGAPREPEAVG